MAEVTLNAYAKINLSLDVIRKRDDGYHEVKMIMQSIGLHDRVTLSPLEQMIVVECSSKAVPSGCENIAYRAAELLISRYGIKSGVKIHIDKRIPVAAGLAGGSTDAAAVLKGMNALFDLHLDAGTLMALGRQIGADVPFCVEGGTMLAEGIGEVLTGLTPFTGVDIVLIKPKISVSTPWVYKNLALDRITERPDTGLLTGAVNAGRVELLARNMKNVLETVTVKEYKIVEEAKKRLLELGAVGSMMSGSGPTVFGIFRDAKTAEKACEEARDESWECFVTYTM